MSTPMTECDPHPWLLFFVESRLWQFELVPPFYEGSDRARCENGYALQVFKNLAARSPQLQTLSYRIINTMNGPPRLPPFFYEPGELLYPPNQIVPSEAVWTHHVLAEVNFAPVTAAALLATCREMRTRILLFCASRPFYMSSWLLIPDNLWDQAACGSLDIACRTSCVVFCENANTTFSCVATFLYWR